MTFINIDLYHNGSNQTDHVITYNREQFICSGIGTLSVELVDTGRSYDPWDEIVLYEEGTKKGTYYIREVVREIGSLKLDCQDASLRLSEYFIPDTYSFPYVTTARYWIERFINDAGVDYTFMTSENGAPINVDAPFGVSTAYEVIMQMLQMSNWYMFFNPNGRCIIGSLTLSTGHPDARVEDDTIIDLQTNTNDKMLRNRAVVWGGADLVYGTWVFADLTVNTPWNYDANDQRAVVLANQSIQTYYDANRLARQILVEFSKITEEKTVTVAGELDVSIGDYIFIDSEFFSGGGMLTTLSSQMGKNGFVTVLTLDQRCPRLFAFIGNYDDYVYIGTAGSGIWRKGLDESIWYDYSTGLTDLGITDLSINSGIFATTTNSGYLFYKTLYTSWMLYSPDANYFVPSGSAAASGIVTLSGITPSGYYASCCTLDKMNYNIYAAYVTDSGIFASGYLASGDINAFASSSGESWILQINSFGNFIRSDKVVFYNADNVLLERVTVIDMDNNGSENLLSVLASGQLITVPPEDDGLFGDTFIVGKAFSPTIWGGAGDTELERQTYIPAQIVTSSSTDRGDIFSSLPSINNDFETLPFESESWGDAISSGSNMESDFGTWWIVEGDNQSASIYRIFWVDTGLSRYIDYDNYHELDVGGSGDELIIGFLKNTDEIFTILTKKEDITVTSADINYSIYQYSTITEECNLIDSYNFSSTFPVTVYPPSTGYISSGYMHVESFFDDLNHVRYLVIADLNNESFTVHTDGFGDRSANRISFNTPIVIKDHLVFSFWDIVNTIGDEDWAWGDIYFMADAVHKYTGIRTRFDELIFSAARECCADLECTSDCCKYTPYANTEPGWVGTPGWKLDTSWIGQDTDTSALCWIGLHMQKGYRSRILECSEYFDEDTYPSVVRLYRFAVRLNPASSAYVVYNQMTEYNSGDIPFIDTDNLNHWEYGFNWSSLTGRFFCGSSVRNEWYMICPKPIHEIGGSTNDGYEIYDILSFPPLLIGAIKYPTDFPSSGYKIESVAPQIDDVDGAIYITWKSGASRIFAGHSSDGSLIKNFGVTCGTPNYIYGNTVLGVVGRFSRWFDYEQPTGATVKNYIVKQKGSDFQAIYDAGVKLGVDTSKSAPTVIYHPPMSGLLSLNISLLGVSYTNESGSFNVQATTFPINDVRVFDIATSSGFVVESGAQDLETFRYIGFVNSGGFFAIDAALASLNILSVITPSGAMASGVMGSGIMASGIMASGLIKLETSNYSPNTPYFFLASPSGFWQRNPGENFFYDYTATLPGASITIIRVDDRL